MQFLATRLTFFSQIPFHSFKQAVGIRSSSAMPSPTGPRRACSRLSSLRSRFLFSIASSLSAALSLGRCDSASGRVFLACSACSSAFELVRKRWESPFPSSCSSDASNSTINLLRRSPRFVSRVFRSAVVAVDPPFRFFRCV
jgi:hypothetical protein